MTNARMGAGKQKFDGHTIYAAIVFAVGAALYCWMFYEMGLLSGRNQERAHIERQHYASEAAVNMEHSCSNLSGAALRECARKVVNSERESQREESDLAAQWSAADWARWASIIAGAQLLATIVGLYFVKRTLDATWQAVSDTTKATEAMERQNNIAEAAQRPWIDIDLIVHRFENTEGVVSFDYSVQFKNIGKSIAERVWHFSHADFFGRDQAADVKRWRDLKWHEAHAKGPSSFAIMPGETYSFESMLYRRKDTIPWFTAGENRVVGAGVIVSVFYKIPGQPPQEDFRRTERFIRFAPTQPDKDRAHSYWVVEDDIRTVQANEITVAKTRSTTTT